VTEVGSEPDFRGWGTLTAFRQLSSRREGRTKHRWQPEALRKGPFTSNKLQRAQATSLGLAWAKIRDLRLANHDCSWLGRFPIWFGLQRRPSNRDQSRAEPRREERRMPCFQRHCRIPFMRSVVMSPHFLTKRGVTTPSTWETRITHATA